MKPDVKRKKSNDEKYMKSSGFKIHHFDKNNIQDIQKLVPKRKKKKGLPPNLRTLSPPQLPSSPLKLCQYEIELSPQSSSKEKSKNRVDLQQGDIQVRRRVKKLIKVKRPNQNYVQMQQEKDEPKFTKAQFKERIMKILNQAKNETLGSNTQREVDGSEDQNLLSKISLLGNYHENQVLNGSNGKTLKEPKYKKKFGLEHKMISEANEKMIPEDKIDTKKSKQLIGSVSSRHTRSLSKSAEDKNTLIVQKSSVVFAKKEINKKSEILIKCQIKKQKKKNQEKVVNKKKKVTFQNGDEQESDYLNSKTQTLKLKKKRKDSREQDVFLPQQDSEFTQSINKGQDSSVSLIKFQKILIGTLPVRNPKKYHTYNSLPNQSINITIPIRKAELYFASDLLKYNRLTRLTTVDTSPEFIAFVDQSLRTSKNCRGLSEPQESTIKKIKLKRNFDYQDKKILCLDLDQTLVHTQSMNEKLNSTLFPYEIQFQDITRHFNIRNYAAQFIKNLSQKFYLVLFTSAIQAYADKILQFLDPNQKYIKHRLYRNNCYLKGMNYPYIKDLRILNRDLSQVILVDNSLYTYWFNIDNGVPIIPFIDRQDLQLRKLQKYLLTLENVDDVRMINRRAFHMHLYQQLQNPAQVLEKYCFLINQQLQATSEVNSSHNQIVREIKPNGMHSRVIIDID